MRRHAWRPWRDSNPQPNDLKSQKASSMGSIACCGVHVIWNLSLRTSILSMVSMA